MIRLVVEIEGGGVTGVYSDAHPEQDFEVDILDRDCGDCDEEAAQENERLEAILRGPGWREIA